MKGENVSSRKRQKEDPSKPFLSPTLSINTEESGVSFDDIDSYIVTIVDNYNNDKEVKQKGKKPNSGRQIYPKEFAHV